MYIYYHEIDRFNRFQVYNSVKYVCDVVWSLPPSIPRTVSSSQAEFCTLIKQQLPIPLPLAPDKFVYFLSI